MSASSSNTMWAPPPEGGRSGWPLRILLIVGGVAVLFALVICAGMIGVGVWVAGPGEQINTETVIGPQSVLIFNAGDMERETGFDAFASRLFVELNRSLSQQSEAEAPAAIRWMQELQTQQNSQSLAMYVPRTFTATVEFDRESNTLQTLWAANPRAFTKLFRLMIKTLAAGAEVRRIEPNAELFTYEDGTAFAFVGGTVIYSSSAVVIERAMERASTESIDPQFEGSLQRLFRQRDQQWTLHLMTERIPALFDSAAFRKIIRSGVASEGDFERRLDLLLGASGLTTLIIGGRFIDDQTIDLEVQALTGSMESMEAWLELLGNGWPSAAREHLSSSEAEGLDAVQIEVETETAGNLARAHYEISGAATGLAHFLTRNNASHDHGAELDFDDSGEID